MEKLVLIDGNSLINRAFYATPLLTAKDGTFTNAVYGFINMLFKMISDVKPTYLAVAFDLKAPTFRHKMYPEYKGTRKPMPEELRPQIPLLKEVLRLMNVKTFELEGVEADDIIGTIAKATDVKTYIITGDKDSFQLVDEQTEVFFTKRGISDIDVYNIDNFKEKTQLSPSQIVDLKSLMGDSSDNIPGIAGVGEKTAKSLLQTYGTLENLLENVSDLKGKLKEKIEEGKDIAILSKTLATINCDCGVDTDLNKMTISTPFPPQLKAKFAELDFKGLLKKEEWFLDGEKEESSKESETKMKIINVEDLNSLPDFSSSSLVSVVLNLTCASVATKDEEYSFKIKQNLFDEGFELSNVALALRPLFEGKTPLVTFDKKSLRHFLVDNFGINLTAPCDDVAIVKYLADFSGRDESLDDFIIQYNFDKNAPAFAILRGFNALYQTLEEEGMQKLYKDVELPLSDVLFEMETAGFKVDYGALTRAGEQYGKIIKELEKQIRDLAGDQTLNVNSPKQLGDLLFEKLKIAKGKKTKTGYSTTAEVLENLEDAHPIIPLILQYRHVQKLYSTYIEGFKPLVDKKTGLVHTTFNQTLTATGRLSSKEPNLQNIPVRDDESREIRKFFVPKSSDRILISADYSQIELRLLSAFSDCKALIDAHNSGKDIHAETASKVFKVPLSEVTSSIRSRAKAVNFGIIYGMSEFGLAKTLKISNAEARNYINSYFEEFPEVKNYMDKNVAEAKELGFAKTLLGRRRYIRELSSSNYNLRQFGERVAMNMPLQGSSADIIKIAMLRVSERIKTEGLKSELILQVHDELIIDAFEDEKEEIERILTDEMENAVSLSVKLTVEIGCGKTWYEAK